VTGRLVGLALGAAAVGTALVLVRLIDIPHAAVLVVLVVAASLVAAHPRTDEPWPRPPAEDRPGGRKDLSELAWAAFSRDGLVTERVLHRVRRIAARRLATRGILWDGRLGGGLDGWGRDERDAADHRARAADLLGADLLAALSTARAVPPRTLDSWFRVLDRLGETPDDARSPR
jgi:hypothetical protein